ncbi:MAG: aspartate--tRNA(Asn) ligase [Nitrososphaerota archaeon]|nr:aspartate--tRNA(Asn) ligase [Nitrososphaerota archaeon]
MEESRTHYISEALGLPAGEKVRLLGWVAVKNQVGGLVFLRIRDGSGYIQLSGRKGSIPDVAWRAASEATLESAVCAEGAVKEDRRAPAGREVVLSDFRILGKAEPWPLRKSLLESPKALHDLRYLALRGPKTSAIIKVRSKLMQAVFDYFFGKGYVYIQAPTLVKAAVEGGATLFPVKYFGETAYLSQSAQLYEEAAICGVDKVFIVQPAFRAEKSRTSRHLTEFWMVEAELAFASFQDVMKVEEELVHHMAAKVSEECGAELGRLGRKVKVPEPPFPRISYDEAIAIAGKGGLKVEWGEDLGTEAEKLVGQAFDAPVFVTGYPVSARSFYHMSPPDNPKITLSADLLAPGGYGELATGGQRLHDYELLAAKVREMGLDAESMKWYMDLRRYGMPRHAGFGIGVERSLRWLLGLKHIRSATLFPRTPSRLYP